MQSPGASFRDRSGDSKSFASTDDSRGNTWEDWKAVGEVGKPVGDVDG